MIIASTTIKHNQLAEENLSSTKIATTDRRVTPFRQKYQYHPTIIVMKNVAPRRNDKDESYGRNNSDNQSLHPSTSLRYSAYEVEQLHSHVPRRNSVAEVEPLRPPIPRARCTTKVESLHLPASRRHSAAEAGHGNHDNIDVNSCDKNIVEGLQKILIKKCVYLSLHSNNNHGLKVEVGKKHLMLQNKRIENMRFGSWLVMNYLPFHSL